MWYKLHNIADWFADLTERRRVVKDFNYAAKDAFIQGYAPTLLQAKTTRGDSYYRHSFSKFMSGGYRIKALSGRPMAKSELIDIAKIVLDDESLVRKLMSLGWDTLEIHDSQGFHGIKYPLKEHANLGGFLGN